MLCPLSSTREQPHFSGSTLRVVHSTCKPPSLAYGSSESQTPTPPKGLQSRSRSHTFSLNAQLRNYVWASYTSHTLRTSAKTTTNLMQLQPTHAQITCQIQLELKQIVPTLCACALLHKPHEFLRNDAAPTRVCSSEPHTHTHMKTAATKDGHSRKLPNNNCLRR